MFRLEYCNSNRSACGKFINFVKSPETAKRMTRITRKDIDKKVESLKALSGKSNLFVDYNSVYGGYRLVSVHENTAGHYGVFGMSDCCDRMSAREFWYMLDGIKNGLEFKK